jgi:hypothetical protein
MRSRMPDFRLAMTLLWISVGIVIVLVAGWWLLKWWKLRHPPSPPAPVPPYSQLLPNPLNEHRPGKRIEHPRNKARRHGK